MSRFFFIAISLGAFSGCVSAQSALPAFEAATVKSIRDDTRTWALRQVSPTRYRSLSNVRQLITWAWNLKNYQVLGMPAWTSEERFEIQATTGHPSNNDEMRAMLQTLLAERFELKVHRESREIPVYALVVGKDGPKIAPAKDGTELGHRGINIEAGVLYSRDGTIDDFVDVLTTNLDRPVVNKTNLTGHYDFSLTWDPPALPAGATWAPAGPGLFTPIRELGLSLNPGKAPVDMLVIESVERPR